MADPLAQLWDVIGQMRSQGADLDDPRRHFHLTYLRTTLAVAEEVARGGFRDPGWLARWDAAFAQLYLDALAADRRGDPVPGPWRAAFDATRTQPDAPPLQHVLRGMNAHINFDLPQALLAVIPPADFDNPALLASRQADHRHIDDVLHARVGAEGRELRAVSRVTVLDRLLQPVNRTASRRLLAEARTKVWRNTAVLDRARRGGESAYAATLSELESRCAQRVRDLANPRFALLRLAWKGFGVLLPHAWARRRDADLRYREHCVRCLFRQGRCGARLRPLDCRIIFRVRRQAGLSQLPPSCTPRQDLPAHSYAK